MFQHSRGKHNQLKGINSLNQYNAEQTSNKNTDRTWKGMYTPLTVKKTESTDRSLHGSYSTVCAYLKSMTTTTIETEVSMPYALQVLC